MINVEMKNTRELNMIIKKIVLVGLVGFALSSCESDKGTTLQDSLTPDNTADANTVVSNLDFGNSVIADSRFVCIFHRFLIIIYITIVYEKNSFGN